MPGGTYMNVNGGASTARGGGGKSTWGSGGPKRGPRRRPSLIPRVGASAAIRNKVPHFLLRKKAPKAPPGAPGPAAGAGAGAGASRLSTRLTAGIMATKRGKGGRRGGGGGSSLDQAYKDMFQLVAEAPPTIHHDVQPITVGFCGKRILNLPAIKLQMQLQNMQNQERQLIEREQGLVTGNKVMKKSNRMSPEEYRKWQLGKQRSGLTGVGDGSRGFSPGIGKYDKTTGYLNIHPANIRAIRAGTPANTVVLNSRIAAKNFQGGSNRSRKRNPPNSTSHRPTAKRRRN
ncbi:hypothetical protein Pelo_2938 [Pelomyxa schiedti]|nr:hypothetical protein Pelo_2938 [Pelomyxa schiedti]